MIIPVNKTVSYAVANVEARSTIFNLVSTNVHGIVTTSLNITFPFSWLDTTNKTIRQGTNRYTETQMTQMFASKQLDFTPIASMVKGLFPTTGQYPSFIINFLDNGKFNGSISHQEKQLDNTWKWISIQLSQDALATAIVPSGYTLAQIKAIVTGFVVETTV